MVPQSEKEGDQMEGKKTEVPFNRNGDSSTAKRVTQRQLRRLRKRSQEKICSSFVR